MSETPSSIDELDELISQPSDAVLNTLENHPGPIAVLGAAGKMGFHLTLMLHRTMRALGHDDRLVAVSRFSSEESRAPFDQHGIETLQADLCDPDQLQSLPDVDHVFFLAGVKFGTSSNPELLRKMNVEMPALVADWFQTSRIVALSTGCVYSFTSPESGGSVEDDDVDPPGDYAKSCLGREHAFTHASCQNSTLVTLVRLNYAVDLRYGVLVDIAQKVAAGEPVNVDMGYLNLIWQGDALDHIVQCLGVASSPPTILNITGTPILKVRDLAEAFGKRFGKSVQVQGEEAPTAWLSNPARAHELFGTPSTSLDQMIDWVASWLEAGGDTLGKPTHFANREGKF